MEDDTNDNKNTGKIAQTDKATGKGKRNVSEWLYYSDFVREESRPDRELAIEIRTVREEEEEMWEMELKNGKIYLNGQEVPNLKSYKISSSATEKGIAELEIVVDVSLHADSEKDVVCREYICGSASGRTVERVRYADGTIEEVT